MSFHCIHQWKGATACDFNVFLNVIKLMAHARKLTSIECPLNQHEKKKIKKPGRGEEQLRKNLAVKGLMGLSATWFKR